MSDRYEELVSELEDNLEYLEKSNELLSSMNQFIEVMKNIKNIKNVEVESEENE